jgi:hypothetical protein
MPSVSAKQEKFMRAVANSPKFAKKVGVPQSVGKEFEMKDKEGKMMKSMGRGMAKADMAKKGMKGYAEGKKVSMDALKAHAAKPASKAHKGLKSGKLVAADGVASKGKTRGMEIKMMNGGMPKTKMSRGSRGC